MSRVNRFYPARLRNFRLSLFEKVILVNSLVLVGEALAGLWVTSHNLEARHYLIDTAFIVLATVLSLLINGMLLRASFRPLFRLLSAVSAGKTDARVPTPLADAEMAELAEAFNWHAGASSITQGNALDCIPARARHDSAGLLASARYTDGRGP